MFQVFSLLYIDIVSSILIRPPIMESYSLPNFPHEFSSIHLCLFHNVKNAASLRTRLVAAATMPGTEGDEARDELDFGFVEASMVRRLSCELAAVPDERRERSSVGNTSSRQSTNPSWPHRHKTCVRKPFIQRSYWPCIRVTTCVPAFLLTIDAAHPPTDRRRNQTIRNISRH